MPKKQSAVRYVGDATPVADPEPRKGKRVAPRDRYESLPLTAEEIDHFREMRLQEAAKYEADPPRMVSGHSLFAQILSATIVDGEIRASVRVTGIVQRPEQWAEAKGETLSLAVPAIAHGIDG